MSSKTWKFSSSIFNGFRGVGGSFHKMKTKTGGTGVKSMSEESTALVGDSLINSPTRNRRPPSDLCHTTYFIFLLMGVGHLLPWNFFITAGSYFKFKFHCDAAIAANDSPSCSHSLEKDFENYFSIAAMLPVCVMAAINIWLQSRIHFKYRMLVSLLGLLVLFVITVAFVRVHSEEWVNGFFAFTILTIVLMNIFSAIFQSSTFGLSGVFPSKYTTVVMGGQGIAGIVAALALILSKLASSNHPTNTALIYFCCALLIIGLSLIAFLFMMRLRFVKHYRSQTSVEVKRSIIKNSTDVALDTSPPFLDIFCKIMVYAVSTYLVFAVTLSLFPAVLSHLESNALNPERSGWTSTYFNPLVCFLMFNASDFSGRFITQWVTFGKNRYVIFVASLLRFGLIPLFLFSNVGQGIDSNVQVFFNSDIISVALVLVLGFSNGYLGSLAMISAPMSLPVEQRETGATIMVFFLSSGLLSGAALSFLWTKVVLKFS